MLLCAILGATECGCLAKAEFTDSYNTPRLSMHWPLIGQMTTWGWGKVGQHYCRFKPFLCIASVHKKHLWLFTVYEKNQGGAIIRSHNKSAFSCQQVAAGWLLITDLSLCVCVFLCVCVYLCVCIWGNQGSLDNNTTFVYASCNVLQPIRPRENTKAS